MKNIIFLATFSIKEDKDAIVQFETHFRDCEVVPVPCTEVEKDGGVFNCISWYVLKADILD
jgi:agmatine deiminase